MHKQSSHQVNLIELMKKKEKKTQKKESLKLKHSKKENKH